MEVTVKTLDSQTKTFNLSLETTVKEFKTKIADEMNIPIEKQRLIFQGKVLQDEKSLQEYKVNGCVVHLVERQPPRATRSNGQSTETTTSSTSTTASPGNMFMGAFAVPVDVMGVTQQIVQGIVQQIGAESAQANISTTSSDDGSSVNVHINLSTVMARNDVRSRIAPARVHLNNVSRIISRLQNDGLPSGRDLNEENSNTETGRQTGNDGSENNNNNNGSALGDLADVLQQVVRLNDEIRPHLERYQELLRSGADRELRSADDLLPDLAAEALHSLSHAYHALSDVTTNFRVPEPRLNVLPSMSPIPVPAAHPRFQDASPSGSQSQPPSSSSSQTTTGTPTGIPFGIGLRPGGGLGTGIGLRTGRGLGPFTLRPGVTLRPGAATFGSRSGIPAGIGLIPTSAGLGGIPGGLGLGGIPAGTVLGTPAGTAVGTPAGNVVGTPATSVPSTNASPATSTATGNVPRPQQNPLAGLPINLRNLPNFAVQFNPAAGNITIAHIVTTVVEETSLRTTTTTTNSTPSPRTSSWGSNPASDNQVTPTPRSDTPMSQDDTPIPPSGNPSTQGGDPSARIINPTSEENPGASQSGTQGDSNPQDSSMNVDQPPNTSASSSSSSSSHSNGQPPSNGQAADGPRDAAVVNFMPQNTNHRDPLLPCQSFHFASLVPRRGQTAPLRRSEPAGQTGDGPRETPAAGNGSVPEMFDLAHLVNISQQRAAEQRAAAAAASGGNTNGVEGNPFLELLIPAGQETSGARNPSEEVMMHMAAQTDERRRTMTPEELAEERADVEQQGTLSRYLLRLLETIPLSQLLMTVLAGTGDPYALSRSMTQAFLREDILRGGEATPENLQRATERILEELEEIFQSSFASCNVKENIDAPATLLTYLRPKIRRLLEIINSSDVDSVYVLEISSLISRMSVELVALTQYCLQDGRTGMEIALRRSVASSPAIAALDPNVRSMVIDTMWACIQDLGNDESLRESTLMPFVVRKEKRKAKKTESPSPKMDRKEEKKKESSNSKRSSDTPRTSAGSSPSSSRRTRSSSQPENVPMETDESWKKVIPAEWVPVISQDIIRQQRMPRQAPFSDAYLNGMPPKRRKIQQPNEPAPYNQCVSATLKRSITKAGVTPKTDLEKLNEEANSSQSLERVFEDEVKSEVRKRLATDTDYNSEKFPSIHKYFEKDEKR